VDILRGIILRGAGVGELWPSVLPLLAYGIVVFAFASVRFASATR
jgi:ABC-2 type transport system permease protein